MDLGILTVSERMQPTLPGVEEATTVDQPLMGDRPADMDSSRRIRPPGSAGADPCFCARDQGKARGDERRSVLLPVRGADAASWQLLCLPLLRDYERLLIGVTAAAIPFTARGANAPAMTCLTRARIA